MRIVGGTARGRRLKAPGGPGTRPTSDRVKESVFGRLDAWGAVSEAAVLDLFCGSGALALEALSRGARQGVGVDSDRAATRVATLNAATLGLDLRVVHERVPLWLRSGAVTSEMFDLVLLDPPYDLNESVLAEVLTLLQPACAADAVVVVERSTRSPEPTWPTGMQAVDPRTYGDTTVWFADVTRT